MITAERLKSVIRYDPGNGHCYWLIRVSNRIKIGDIAGHLNKIGYMTIRIDGRLYQAHQLIWFYMTGSWVPEIDHKDTVKSNNVWSNLREAKHRQNCTNVSIRSHNRLGVKGVCWCKKKKKYRATIVVNGKQRHLGYFDAIDLASAAYRSAAQEYFGDFARAAA